MTPPQSPLVEPPNPSFCHTHHLREFQEGVVGRPWGVPSSQGVSSAAQEGGRALHVPLMRGLQLKAGEGGRRGWLMYAARLRAAKAGAWSTPRVAAEGAPVEIPLKHEHPH